MARHFYTVDPNGELAPRFGFQSEGIACYVFSPPPSPQPPGTVPLYRWNNQANAEHFFTVDQRGEIAPQLGFQAEGIACYVYNPTAPHPAGTVPFYRWAQPGLYGEHFYTVDPDGDHGRASQRGFLPEGIACFVYNHAVPGTVPFYKWFNPTMLNPPTRHRVEIPAGGSRQASLAITVKAAWYQRAIVLIDGQVMTGGPRIGNGDGEIFRGGFSPANHVFEVTAEHIAPGSIWAENRFDGPSSENVAGVARVKLDSYDSPNSNGPTCSFEWIWW